jgi:cytochrome c peroxidase
LTGGPRTGIAEVINPRLLRRFRSIRSEIEGKEGAPSERQVELGRKLFFDKRLSGDRDLSCNSCHQLDRYGVDGERTSPGHRGNRGRRNAPSVYHAAGHLAQFWDGRSADVERQAMDPIVNPIEMGMMNPGQAIAVLKSIPGYVKEFAAAFPDRPDPIDADNVGRAIGAFGRRLITRSRWDRFLDGDRAALSPLEVEGLKLFADIGCVQCHTGEYLGGSMFQKVGAAEPWPNQEDQGRFDVTHQEADRMQFKVPSLRNVAMTAPYFHDGSVDTIEAAVAIMGRFQLGAPLQEEEVKSIVAWMQSLTGELPARYLKPPELPPDGPRTAAIAAR